jgi:hypothetical protein
MSRRVESPVPRHSCRFRQTELARAVKALRAAGVKVERVEVDPDGKIRVIVKDGDSENSKPAGEWDDVLK